MALCAFSASAQSTLNTYTSGDVNHDGTVTVEDVTDVVKQAVEQPNGSTNTNVDVSELLTLLHSIDNRLSLLESATGAQRFATDFVDLGLPSGTLWATRNVGANSPEEYGDFFAWGEVAPKAKYAWSSYSLCNGSNTKMNKYCTSKSYGTVDKKKQLELSDDAAYVNWGEEWCMPTNEQMEELGQYCSKLWTSINNVYGLLLRSKLNAKTIFLPAAGYMWTPDGFTVVNAPHINDHIEGYYWTNQNDGDYTANYAYVKEVDSEGKFYGGSGYYNDRERGYTIRPVRRK